MSPIPDNLCPPFLYILNCQIHKLQARILAWENLANFHHLAKTTVEALDRIRRVYQLPDFRRIGEKRRELSQVGFPEFRDVRILLIPALCKLIQHLQALLLGGSGVDLFQICSNGLRSFQGTNRRNYGFDVQCISGYQPADTPLQWPR